MNNNKSLDEIIEEFYQQDLSMGLEQDPLPEIPRELGQTCMSWMHQYVNVGFHFDKWVCKHCDMNKPEEGKK